MSEGQDVSFSYAILYSEVQKTIKKEIRSDFLHHGEIIWKI